MKRTRRSGGQREKRILVTGGAGYVGAVLVPKLLEKGYRVRVLDWFLFGKQGVSEGKNNPLLEEIQGDIRSRSCVKKALHGVDVVVHLACISNDPSFELDPALGRSVNYDATVQLFELSKQTGVRRFIYASSSSVYGVKNETEVTEDLTLEPLTEYSKYKALCEEYITKMQKNSRKKPTESKGKGRDTQQKKEKTTYNRQMTAVILRPATVCGYSPRMRLDLTVNMLTIQAVVKRRITVFGGSQLRPNIHIEDMTDLYVNTVTYPDAKIEGKIFNAGYENYSVLDIAKMVKRTLADARIEIIVTPTDDLRSYCVSSEKIARELGFRPKHTVEQAISDIKQAYEEGKIPDPLTDKRYYNIKMMQSNAHQPFRSSDRSSTVHSSVHSSNPNKSAE